MTHEILRLNNLLKKEVALKGRSSSIFFCLFSIFSFFYGFGLIEYLWLIKLTSILIFLNSLYRIYFQEKILKKEFISKNDWHILTALIWLNSIGFGIIINLASFELKLSGFHFIVLTTLLSGIIGASTVTLSYFPYLFIPFQVLLLVPQIFIILYFYNYEGINHTPLIFLYVLFFFYQLIQYRKYREEIIKLFKYQLELEVKNEELKKSQEELVNQTLKVVHTSRLAALGEISASIAHEINNPVTIIQNSNKLIEKSVQHTETEKIKETISKNSEKIAKSVDRVTRIIKGLKNMANNSEFLPKESITLAYILDETGFFCSEFLIGKNIELIIDPPPQLSILCHPVQVSQVLINLIKNAGDYLFEIEELERKWIHLQFEKLENEIVIKVINNGPKITDELKTKIFEPFYTTKPVEKGTGLGLSISKQIMKEHEGIIDLHLDNEYTTFVLNFPIHHKS